jgi:hypothetical protein
MLQTSQMATRCLQRHQRESTMTGSMKTSILDRGTRQRGARIVAGSLLQAHYAAAMAEPLPAELKDIVAQLVAHDACTKKSGEVLQIAPPLPGRQS